MATIMERGGRYTARVRKGGITRTQTFTTEIRAKYWARETERQIQQGIDHGKIDPHGRDVAAMIDAYIKEARANPNVPLGHDKLTSFKHLKEFFPHKPIKALSSQDVVRFAKHRRKTVAPATIEKNISYLGVVLAYARGVWRWDISETIISDARVSLKAQSLVAQTAKMDRVVKPSEERALLHYFDRFSKHKMPMGDIIRFQLATALRLGETTRIEWRDYDADEGTIIVRERKHPTMKQGRTDTVPLTNRAIEVIERQPKTDARIFPYLSSTISSAFNKSQHRFDFDHVRIHDLRHTALTKFAEAGLSLPELQVISGHTSVKHLMRYLHVRPKSVRDKIADL